MIQNCQLFSRFNFIHINNFSLVLLRILFPSNPYPNGSSRIISYQLRPNTTLPPEKRFTRHYFTIFEHVNMYIIVPKGIMISELFSSISWMYFSYVLSFIIPLFCGLTLLLIKEQRTKTTQENLNNAKISISTNGTKFDFEPGNEDFWPVGSLDFTPIILRLPEPI